MTPVRASPWAPSSLQGISPNEILRKHPDTSLFQFLISRFRSGGRYFMWSTASLKVPRCCMIFFWSRMMA
jgi:hypothetical protein